MHAALLPLAALALLSACATTTSDKAERAKQAEAQARQMSLAQRPPMRWGQRSGADAWTRATLTALDREGVKVLSRVPSDIDAFCPNYAQLGAPGRKAFWAGLLSAVAKHESTYNPKASGGGGKWIGLMQIAPATWRNYNCDGNIRNGADNMSCAVRIMSRQVARDNAVANDGSGWRGVARDWAPMRNPEKRADIAAWTSSQSYCTPRG
ncbi:MAG: lytic transglycosylase domain-containing protein [Paracoccus sp. (in: a-proteobacteria)]|uniref:lytic transglycosylase domain-containing protein n=1 Tax=unclassified Paracoccus (in: a-proteobacteria) TaxID=2688777 RepID=UPI000C4BEAB7|nr:MULTISPECIES: lytic transglycosylase domain-containing protein [unclassified Paracoccus (in: a-proteobacteria)]MAN55358.1 lytic transglycosylase [Paracoccus sp. (in: a-proteobacteria)]HIC67271.1 lytic transglycosylase domain-containing protein [Paracoccus sp. (in: a-proteobacteria)]|tara:strand:- start:3526 stop:4152 length:627 start_codon:yes stop_codon:yes gene_type:complete